jgi:hypothetical protein
MTAMRAKSPQYTDNTADPKPTAMHDGTGYQKTTAMHDGTGD